MGGLPLNGEPRAEMAFKPFAVHSALTAAAHEIERAERRGTGLRLGDRDGRTPDNMPASLTHKVKGLSRGVTLGFRHRGDFAELEAYCSFVGCARSGSSLVGSLLDAHPEVVIAQELDALRLIEARVPRHVLYGLILAKDARFTADGRTWTGYNYAVPNQWQGRFERLRVIGDKKAGFTTRRLNASPALLDRLRDTVAVPLRFVHVVRNPFDNIAAMAQRSHMPLAEATEKYFQLARDAAALGERLQPGELIAIRHEALTGAPHDTLSRLCTFLGVEANKGYLDDCASIVFNSPHRRRADAGWSPELVKRVQSQIDDVPVLSGYTFDD